MKNILLTGGTGYIGSHVAVELLSRGYSVTIVDNLSNSEASVVERIGAICNVTPNFIKADLLDVTALETVFANGNFSAVIHLAGKKAVGESVRVPLEYYRNNVIGTINLLDVCRKYNVKNFIFSSSATVYGACKTMPVTEESPLGCTNPYGWTKLTIERILQDVAAADSSFNVALLRYFNPVGAHYSGLIGEYPSQYPNNLTPYVLKVAGGMLPHVNVFGNDYATPDGTGVRDYIHVCDLAVGHVAVLDQLFANCGVVAYNLGTGKGYSVLEVIEAFSRACGHNIPYKFAPRRDGDVAYLYADCSKAEKQLHWRARLTLDDMATSGWRWQQYYMKHLAGDKQ